MKELISQGYSRTTCRWRLLRLNLVFSLMIGSVGVIIVGPASAAEGLPTEKNLTRFFESVVFGAEYDEVTNESTVIKKWVSPIRASISALEGDLVSKPGGGKELKLRNARPKDAHVNSIRKHLGTLVKLTGITTEDAKKTGQKPNYFIKFVPRLAMHLPSLIKEASPGMLRKLATPGVCYFLTMANKKGEITRATIIVNNQMTDRQIDSCLLEEMTQTLGLPNDSDIVKPSVFNNRSVLNRLTRNDLIVVATLYDERMKPGLARAKAVAKAGSIIGDMLNRLK